MVIGFISVAVEEELEMEGDVVVVVVVVAGTVAIGVAVSVSVSVVVVTGVWGLLIFPVEEEVELLLLVLVTLSVETGVFDVVVLIGAAVLSLDNGTSPVDVVDETKVEATGASVSEVVDDDILVVDDGTSVDVVDET